jgi:hypothetical protein
MEKTDDKSVGRESDKFMLRLPDGMRERIAEFARQNGRSMNAEIVARLEGSFNEDDGARELVGIVGKLVDVVKIYKDAADSQKAELTKMRKAVETLAPQLNIFEGDVAQPKLARRKTHK